MTTVIGTRLLVVEERETEKVHGPRWAGPLIPGLGAVTQLTG